MNNIIQKTGVWFEAGHVLDACDRFLNSRLVDWQQLQEPSIQKKMKGSLFTAACTREEAISALYGDLFNNLKVTTFSGEYPVKRAFELKSLANLAMQTNEKVFLDVEDASLLAAYLDKSPGNSELSI